MIERGAMRFERAEPGKTCVVSSDPADHRGETYRLEVDVAVDGIETRVVIHVCRQHSRIISALTGVA